MAKRLRALALLVIFVLPFFSVFSAPAYASGAPLIVQGVAKVLGSVIQLPFTMLKGSTQAFPLGIVGGAIGGTMKAVLGTVSGGMDIAKGSAPYAKYAALAL